MHHLWIERICDAEYIVYIYIYMDAEYICSIIMNVPLPDEMSVKTFEIFIYLFLYNYIYILFIYLFKITKGYLQLRSFFFYFFPLFLKIFGFSVCIRVSFFHSFLGRMTSLLQSERWQCPDKDN